MYQRSTCTKGLYVPKVYKYQRSVYMYHKASLVPVVFADGGLVQQGGLD